MDAYASRESDSFIVVRKLANKVQVNTPDHGGAGGAKGTNRQKERDKPIQTVTQSAEGWTTGLSRLHTAAKRDRSLQFNNLLHHITPELLVKAYHRLNRKASKGVDGESWQCFGQNLAERVQALHTRIHTQAYKPQSVLRIWIPKADGDHRPIGITTVEDKVVQQALVWVLEAIYEADFLGFSYGFRPGRNQHQALDAVYMAITTRKVSWIVDADISRFFDQIDHGWMMKFLQHRIADKRILRLVEQTLRAGVVDDGRKIRTRLGTPQGAVISPLLANIYLHYVLDLWAHQWRRKQARGEGYIVRFADDSVMGFQYRSDALHFTGLLHRRLEKFGLKLNKGKTRLLEFGRFATSNRKQKNRPKPETFDFLGFTHICSTRRSDGGFTVKRFTSAKKLTAKLKEIKQILLRNRHRDVFEQGKWLKSVVQGHNNYFAVPGNLKAINLFRREICRYWLRALRKRSQRHTLTWTKMTKLIKYFIPSSMLTHPYPNQRLCV
ncbi:DNA polymerase [Endozoicomonas numazuensis]|uniref:DNA polymerase n=1 Tax=Endozoicomonas numazuensis TaxID=1137799 RepID=A0A081NFI3_9GAMM|nr:DNA polymerase [Endozoicomonas numazuensis]